MRRALLQHKERTLATERSLKCRGTASIKLDVLYFPPLKTKDPDKAKKNVERLRKAFQDEGCRRLPLLNHIPAIIDQQCLDTALRNSKVSAERLGADHRNDYPELEFPPGYRLQCLDGQSRTLAAAQVLPTADKRWTVDLYLAGTSL
jgi:hypothetical protein